MMNIMQLETRMEFLIRVLLTGICEGIVGHERKSHNKGTGIRAHLTVVSGATLIMIVSRYGLSDIPGDESIALDPSCIATQIVIRVGFLGAGMIFMWKNTISGLTTAVDIWATNAIGMVIGSGLYALGILTAVLIVFVRIILHRNHRWLRELYREELFFVVDQSKEVLQDLQERLKYMQIEILSMSLTQEHSCYQVDLIVALPDTYRATKLLNMFHDVAYIYETSAQGIAKS